MATRAFSATYAMTSAAALQFTAGANEALLISSATVVNYDVTGRNFTCYIVDPGGSAGNGNRVESKKALSINQATTLALSGKSLTPGMTLWANIDSGTACTLQISGTIITQAA